jgi:hypothetical protein
VSLLTHIIPIAFYHLIAIKSRGKKEPTLLCVSSYLPFCLV